MAAVVSNDISWITGRSYDHISQITRQRNNFYSYNNSNLRRMNLNNYNINNNNDDDSSTSFSKKLINRRIEFVRPRNSDNARPSTTSTESSSNSTGSSQISVVKGHQRSEFNPAKRHLFEESDVQQLMKWPKELLNKSGGAGLRNLGNTCFMNASLQCMCYTPPLQNYLKTGHHGSRCRIRGYCAFCELQDLFPQMVRASSNQAGVPRTIFSNLPRLSSALRPGRQEDAHEFITNFIDYLQTCALKTEPEKIKDLRIQESSIVHKIFGGYLRSQVKCCKCGNESNTYDAVLHLSLELKNCTSVDAALRHYTSDEILNGDNKYRCSRCKKKRKAHKKLSIFEPPNVLILHLKRFEFGGGSHMGGRFMYGGYGGRYGGGRGGKIDRHINFNEILDITHLQSYPTSSKVSYSLYGVLIHHGSTPNSGHYTSHIKAPNGSWYYMDDSSVSNTHINRVLNSNAYILFYIRNERKILYKSPALTPKNTFMHSNPKDFDLDAIKNVLPNEEPAIFKLDDHSNDRIRSDMHNNNGNNKTSKNTNPTQNTTNDNEPIVNYSHIKTAAADSIDTNVLNVGNKRSNKSVILNGYSEEPPFKRRRMSNNNGIRNKDYASQMNGNHPRGVRGIMNNDTIDEFEVKADVADNNIEDNIDDNKYDSDDNGKEDIINENALRLNKKKWVRGRNGRSVGGPRVRAWSRRVNTRPTTSQVLLQLKQQRKMALLRKKQNNQKQKYSLSDVSNGVDDINNTNDNNNNNNNDVSDALDNNTQTTLNVTTNNVTPGDSNGSDAKPTKKKRRKRKNKNKNKNKDEENNNSNSNSNNNSDNTNKSENNTPTNTKSSPTSPPTKVSYASIARGDIKHDPKPDTQTDDKIETTNTNINITNNNSGWTKFGINIQSRQTNNSNESDTAESIHSVLSSSGISAASATSNKSISDGNHTSSGTSSPNSTYTKNPRNKDILGIINDNNHFNVNRNHSITQKLKEINNNQNDRINSKKNTIIVTESNDSLNASKREINAFLHGINSRIKENRMNNNNNKDKSELFGRKVSVWDGQNNEKIINSRNEALFSMEEYSKNFIPEKDSWEKSIDFERTQGSKNKKKKDFNSRWNDFNRLKNKNGFEMIQKGEMKKNKKRLKGNRHKKQVNYKKYQKRSRKVE